MHFIMNDDTELDYIELNSVDTVQSICESLEIFFSNYTLNCYDCDANCCAILPIRPDNVFMKNLNFIKDRKEKCNICL